MNNFKSTSNQAKGKAKKEQLAKWISQQITSQEYSQKEIDTLIYLVEKGKQEEAWKILLKNHKLPSSCYCQKETKTWQERINKAQLLLQLAEREGNEAEKLRIKETSHLLSNYFK